jgi:HK97 family phage portal protein
MDVEVERQSNGLLRFLVRGEDRPLTTEEIIYIPDLLRPGKVRGVSRVEALKEDFGLALALRNFAATFFGQGTSMNGVIEYPGALTAEQATQLTEAFDSRHRGWKRGHKTGVLTGGAQFKPTQVDPDRAQALEARRFAVEDVARAFGIPSVFLNVPDSMSFSSYEQSARMLVTHTLRPLVGKIEGAFSPLLSRVPGGDTAFLRFNLDGLARADLQARMSSYSTGLQSGFLTINDVRRLEDLRPIMDDAADTVRVPLANVAIDESHLKADETRVKMAQQLVSSGYQPAAVLEALGLPPIDHTGLASVQVRPAEEGGALNESDQ